MTTSLRPACPTTLWPSHCGKPSAPSPHPTTRNHGVEICDICPHSPQSQSGAQASSYTHGSQFPPPHFPVHLLSSPSLPPTFPSIPSLLLCDLSLFLEHSLLSAHCLLRLGLLFSHTPPQGQGISLKSSWNPMPGLHSP